MKQLPGAVAELVDELASMEGVVAVVLGGSRALEHEDNDSDWDIGLYYRATVDLTRLSTRGVVHPPGAWGRLMNGGAWLRCGGAKVDVLLRDLDVVDHWTRRAEDGDFEVDSLLGYLAGIPTYTLTAELASCEVLAGDLPRVSYPPRLSSAAPQRWRFCRSFSLQYAHMHAHRGNCAAAMGQVARAVMEEGHARLSERSEWVCNEKRLIDAAGLSAVQEAFTSPPADAANLRVWIDRVAAQLGMDQEATMPWTGAGRI